MKKEYKEIKIIALIAGNHIFVGRTSSQKVSAVCHSHIRGEKLQTKEYFGSDPPKRPELYVLERLTVHSTIAYRHLLAWIHVFTLMGYHVINRKEVTESAANLHPDTAKIAESILSDPFPRILERSHCKKYSDADRQPVETTKPQQVHKSDSDATEKLTIRLSPAEKQAFDRIARDLHLTHRKTLQYMLQTATISEEDDVLVRTMVDKHEQEIHRLNEKVSELENKLNQQREKAEIRRQGYVKYINTVRRGISGFMKHFEASSRMPLTIEVGWYKEYMRNCSAAFEYPQKEGFALFRPLAVLRGSGRNPAYFVTGVTAQGQYIKLRFYHKSYFAGLFFTNPAFGLRGSCWYIGWEREEENVMQLVFSMPLQIKAKFENPMDLHERLDKLTQQLLEEDPDF